MFIEKLTKQDFIDFSKNYVKEKLIGAYKRHNDVYFTMQNKIEGSTLNYYMSDFKVIAVDYQSVIKSDEINKLWKQFMCDKFKEEYKQAYNQNLKKQYEEDLIK